MLTEAQTNEYRENGYVVVRGAISKAQISALVGELDGWIEKSRLPNKNWGSLPNGKSIFDLEAGHTAQSPRLRRVGNPCDISAVYKDFVWNGPLADLVVPLIGPNVKFMDCRINLKLPGMAVSRSCPDRTGAGTAISTAARSPAPSTKSTSTAWTARRRW